MVSAALAGPAPGIAYVLAMPEGEIGVDDPRAPDVRQLLERHLRYAASHSRPEDVHALTVEGLLDPAVTLFGFRRDGELLGVGALKHLDGDHAELKSMHVAEAARGRGVGRAILEHLVDVACGRGLHRLSLETGSTPGFVAARSLYLAAGFTPCGPFGDFCPSPQSTYLTLSLIDGGPLRAPGRAPRRQTGHMSTYHVNTSAVAKARELIDAGAYDETTEWSDAAPSTARENEEIEQHGYDGYGQWHLGIHDDASEETKGRYGFPYGDFATVNRAALNHAKQRATQNEHHEIADAADTLLQRLDDKRS